jgi:hypothetical protein
MTKETPHSEPLLIGSQSYQSNNNAYYPQSDNPYHSSETQYYNYEHSNLNNTSNDDKAGNDNNINFENRNSQNNDINNNNTDSIPTLTNIDRIEQPHEIPANSWPTTAPCFDSRVLVCPFTLVSLVLFIVGFFALFTSSGSTGSGHDIFYLFFGVVSIWFLQMYQSCAILCNYPNRSYIVPTYQDSDGNRQVFIGNVGEFKKFKRNYSKNGQNNHTQNNTQTENNHLSPAFSTSYHTNSTTLNITEMTPITRPIHFDHTISSNFDYILLPSERVSSQSFRVGVHCISIFLHLISFIIALVFLLLNLKGRYLFYYICGIICPVFGIGFSFLAYLAELGSEKIAKAFWGDKLITAEAEKGTDKVNNDKDDKNGQNDNIKDKNLDGIDDISLTIQDNTTTSQYSQYNNGLYSNQAGIGIDTMDVSVNIHQRFDQEDEMNRKFGQHGSANDASNHVNDVNNANIDNLGANYSPNTQFDPYSTQIGYNNGEDYAQPPSDSKKGI